MSEATDAARQTGLSVLATLRATLGSLNRVSRLLKSLVMVNAVPEFEEHIGVANGYALLMRDVFGEDAGVGSRSAVGVGSLPGNIPVEIELMVEINEAEATEAGIRPNGPTGSWMQEFPELRRVINGCGHFTSLGGSRLHPRALEAIQGISGMFVDINALLLRAGERVAKLARAPPGYSAHVTTGASAGLALATAACLCRGQPSISAQLPDTSGLQKTEVVVDAGSDQRWLQSIALTGATIVKAGSNDRPMTASELKAAVCDRTALIIYFAGAAPHGLALEDVIAIAKVSGTPVIVDAAARLPPISNLHSLAEAGADCVLFSGGKAVRGPQTSGFMIGKQWLIEGARMNACPNENTCCRPMKTSKESVVGLVAALEAFVEEQTSSTGGHAYPHGPSMVARRLADRLWKGDAAGVSKHFSVQLQSGASASMHDVQPNAHDMVFVHFVGLKYSPAHAQDVPKAPSLYGDGVDHGSPLKIIPRNAPTWVASRLASGSPAVCVNTTATGLLINPYLLVEEEADHVASRIMEEVNALAKLQQSPKTSQVSTSKL